MKRTIIAVSLIVLLFAFCLLETEKINTICDDMENRVAVISALYENGDAYTKEKCEELKKTWERDSKKAAFFINHGYIEQLTDSISILPVFAVTNSDDMFYANTESIKKVLNQIRNDSRLSADSFY